MKIKVKEKYIDCFEKRYGLCGEEYEVIYNGELAYHISQNGIIQQYNKNIFDIIKESDFKVEIDKILEI